MSEPANEFWTEEEYRPGPKLPHVFWSELGEVDRRARYLVNGVLPQRGLSIVFGRPSSGKSFFALDVAAHVALGWRWMDRRTHQAGVVYIAAEGQEGFRKRITAFRSHFSAPEAPFMCITTSVDLRGDKGGAKALCEDIAVAGEKMGIESGLVVIDTLSRCTPDAAENTSEEMTGFLDNCEQIFEAIGCHVMVVHHSPRTNTGAPRGHSSLEGAADMIFQVTEDEDTGCHAAKMTKQKDGEAGNAYRFDLLHINLGNDDEGDPITSCVCAMVDAEDDRSLTGLPAKVHGILTLLLGQEGQKAGHLGVSGMGLSEGANVLPLKRLREEWDKTAFSGCPAQDTKRKPFGRAIGKLKMFGIADYSTKWIWLCEKPETADRTSGT